MQIFHIRYKYDPETHEKTLSFIYNKGFQSNILTKYYSPIKLATDERICLKEYSIGKPLNKDAFLDILMGMQNGTTL